MSEDNTISQIEQYINQHEIRRIRVGYSDFNGLMRGKMISVDKFLSALKSGGLGFYDGIMGCSLHDEMVPGLKSTGWHSGFADSKLAVVIDSCRHIPFEDGTLFFLTEITAPHSEVCPRQVLKRVLEKAKQMGFGAKASVEYEFTAFDLTPEDIYNPPFTPTPYTPANCGYSILRTVTESELHTGLMDLCDVMDFPLDGLHTEEGPGFLEAAIQVDDALKAADKATLFKTFSKAFAQRHQLCFSFMAKWNKDLQGQGGHTHVSLYDNKGSSVFYDEQQPSTISQTMRHFIAGQQKLLPELTAMIAPNVNSYTRLVPGFWATTAATWGLDNRTCALRAITGSAKAQRVEYRVPGADSNPYLSIAAALASGLYGIEHQLEPSDPIQGNAYEQQQHAEQLPSNLADAAERLKTSSAARELFGDGFIDDFATTRAWEAHEASKQVTDWQLRRYLELT